MDALPFGPDAVLGFLAERGGRAPHAELVRHFRAALGGEAEQRARARARFKDLVNAVATVRTDPADGTKYVHLKRQFREGSPPAGAGHGGPGAPPGAGDGRARSPDAAPAAPAPPDPRREPAPGGRSPQPRRGPAPGGARGRAGGEPDAASAGSAAELEGGGAVTLDPLEHAWMLSAADGRWDGLEGLLSCEPALLTKRDFITGYSCLHWAAKHGRHELLAMLVSFAGQHRLPVDINARTSGGYTALHLAAMHGHVEVVKLLVGAYDADVDARDYSGRKASQYLSRGTAEEIRSLVGALEEEAPEGGAAGGGSGRWRLSRVLPAHLLAHRPAHAAEDAGDPPHPGTEGGAARRGPHAARARPRLGRLRFRTQGVPGAAPCRPPEPPLEEEDEEDEEGERAPKAHPAAPRLRPKSSVFG
ncbi:ankyrin repeat domain-containing protein SOWAHC [Sorex fumeus]|uniref:ankyrin repeat domain-containing protein SOWAHC n=1 Tax=Sorex fumeus TaxID=62283 RepID=UPI0024AC82BD|nr:ankyrin repeat domain-containing protein SOWAHC [Sorex fumeus]